MRIAILSLDGAAGAVLAGTSLAARQLDLAIDLGAEKIVALGHGAEEAALDLRQRTERAGLPFVCVPPMPRRLLGMVGASDDIIVLSPGLLAGARDEAGLQALAKGRGVLVFPAGPGNAAGFERIDAESAWAGVLVAPGQVIERLAPLPDDSDPVSGLLRGARQAGVRSIPLPPALLDAGDWRLLATSRQVEEYAPHFLRSITARPPRAPTRWLAATLAKLASRRLLALPPAVIPGLTLLALAGAIALGFYGFTAAGFGVLAFAALVHHLGLAIARIARRGLRRIAPKAHFAWAGLLGVDAAFVAIYALAFLAPLGPRLFVPLALVLALRVLEPMRSLLARVWRDRGLVATVAALAAAVGQLAPVAMLWTLSALLLATLWPERQRD